MNFRQRVWLVRHGETQWSLSGQHTGRTDIPLTDRGRRIAGQMRGYLNAHQFGLVLTSPLARATETCRLAGFGETAQPEPNLREWDYGIYEGRTTDEIRREEPDWSIWRAEIKGGESLEEVASRARALINTTEKAEGDVLMFGHGHIFRILAAAWLGLSGEAGRLLALDTAGLSILGYEREIRVLRGWNRSLVD